MSRWRHLRAALLPLAVAVAVPVALLYRTRRRSPAAPSAAPARRTRAVAGSGFLAAGLLLIGSTVRLFAREGRGTLAPWDPTQRLVVRGPYRYVRNPMISGVLSVLLGEAVLFGSAPLLLWAGAFFAVNAVYLPLSEEPGLEKRFGGAYRTYCRHVPRWLPRRTPWRQDER